VALTCAIVAHLDLASYASVKRASRLLRQICEEHREASPHTVCCRTIPVQRSPSSVTDSFPNTLGDDADDDNARKRQRFEYRLRRSRDLFPDADYRRPPLHDAYGPRKYTPTRSQVFCTRLLPPPPPSDEPVSVSSFATSRSSSASSSSSSSSSSVTLAHVMAPPTPPPPSLQPTSVTAAPRHHTLLHLSPRVLDLHHVRLDQENFLALVAAAAPRLETLCMDAGGLDYPSRQLALLPRLTSLCLYAVRRGAWIDSLVGLTRLTRLAVPFSVVHLGVDGRRDDLEAENCRRRLPPSVTDLTFLRAHGSLRRVDWAKILGGVPLLEHLRMSADFPPPFLLLKFVPRLRTLAACDNEVAVDREFDEDDAKGDENGDEDDDDADARGHPATETEAAAAPEAARHRETKITSGNLSSGGGQRPAKQPYGRRRSSPATAGDARLRPAHARDHQEPVRDSR
jgi:hypothetical protein